MRVTVEFDSHDEDRVLEEIVGAAAQVLSARADRDFRAVATERIKEVGDEVIRTRVGAMIDEVMEDEAVGLPTMIMERLRHEIADRLPPRLQKLVVESLRELAREEAVRQQAERPRRGGRWRGRR